MKLGPVTKIDKRNSATLKYFNYGVTSDNCEVIVVFPIMVNLEQSVGRLILDD